VLKRGHWIQENTKFAVIFAKEDDLDASHGSSFRSGHAETFFAA
jgi:hypothetical protein